MTNAHSAAAKPFAMTEAEFGDGTYKFGLTWALAADWETQSGRSLYATFANIVAARSAWIDDVREFIRMGLIGGGTSPADAVRLVRLYVEERPLTETLPLAVSIVDAFLNGPEKEAGANVTV